MTTLLPKNLPQEETEMKRADRRSTINILVLGDPGVGKSSLISTFVSRYFSHDVPAIMARVRLPPDPGNSCITTIVDSQGGDAALISAVAALSYQTSESSLQALLERAEGATTGAGGPLFKRVSKETASTAATPAHVEASMSASASRESTSIERNVDSIILVYDLDRVETFFRLERHWLPLIQRCYKGKVPVIVAENKMDLFRPSSSAGTTSDEQALARKRQQIVSLMQQFPFVRQCIKCSAKTLVRVDDVFLKAQQAVLYPFTPPLYDLETGRLTAECQRALTRIFRMYDRDHDGLLSDAELDRFQRETYHVAVFDRDFAAWKKVVTRHASDQAVVLQNGKFTVAGFLAIFDVFISQNRLDVVWQALREFLYDDDLQLHIPMTVLDPYRHNEGGTEGSPSISTTEPPGSWKLTSSAKKFLAALFHQFDTDHDGKLTAEDMANIFSILPPPGLPPWLRPGLFEECFSHPKEVATPGVSSAASPASEASPGGGESTTLIVPPAAMAQSLSNSGLSILSASDSLPSVDMASHSSLFMNHKPLTFLEWMGLWHTVTAVSPAIARSELFRLGHVEDYRSAISPASSRRTKKKERKQFLPPEASLKSREIRVLVLGSSSCGKTALVQALCRNTNGANVLETRTTTKPETTSTFVKLKRRTNENKKLSENEEFVVHLVFTDVPESSATVEQIPPQDQPFDLALLVFDCTLPSSWNFVKTMEATLLNKETPRVFIASKADLAETPEPEDGDAIPATVVDSAEVHCRELDVEPPLSTTAGSVVDKDEERLHTLDHVARCALHMPGVARLRSRPHEEQKRREAARRRKIMWLGGIVSVGVVVAVGMGLLWGSGAATKAKDQKGSFGWLRSWFGGGGNATKESAPTTA